MRTGSRKRILERLSAAAVLCLAAVVTRPTIAQQSSGGAFDGEWRYRVSCATCHGIDGEGVSAFGPPLKGNAFVMNLPEPPITTVIQRGRYSRNKAYPEYAGMPAFYYIRADEAEALVNYMKGTLQQ